MDKGKQKELLEAFSDRIKNLLKVSESESFCSTWVDTFSVLKIDGKTIVIGYYGTAPLRKFKKECKKILRSHIRLVVGYKADIKVVKRKKVVSKADDNYVQGVTVKEVEAKDVKAKDIHVKNARVKKNVKAAKFLVAGFVFVCIAAGLGIVLCNYIENRNFRETFYNVSSLKVNNPVRVLQLSDLHRSAYGKENEILIERVKKLQPDLIVCTGDMLEASDPDIRGLEQLGKGLSEAAPLYYIYGNNEVETVYDIPLNQTELDEKFGFTEETRDETQVLLLPDTLEPTLESAGFKVLKNKKDTITVGTTPIDIYGVLNSNPSSFWTYTAKSFAEYIYEDVDNLKITAIHEPFIFEEFEPDFWGDLMVCGHTHGGEIRVPVLGPLYTREGGLFPERNECYVYGRYDVAGRPLIVSSGLDNANLLRINNQPEIVIIDINKF